MQFHIPTVHTPRLALIPFIESHFDTYASLYGAPAVMEHIGPPLDRVEAWKLMARHAGHWILRGYGGWLVQVQETDEIIGVTGIMYPEGNIEMEVGWIIKPESWGKGYATEAAGAALAYAFDTVGAKRVMARIAAANVGSISVARKLGMVLDTELSDKTVSIYFTLPKV